MKRNSFFVVSLFNVSIDFDLGEGIRIDDTLSITNNKEHICKLTNSVNLKREIGGLEFRAMKDSTALVYGFLSPIPPTDVSKLHRTLADAMYLTQSFADSLWHLKDNCVSFEMGFLESQYQGRYSNVVSNFIHGAPFDSSGKRSVAEFSHAELERAKHIYSTYRKGQYFKSLEGLEPNKDNRLLRVSLFLKAARNTTMLPIKVSFYCTCFEALFSTDTAELSHKLSERTALFLGADGKERLEIFQNVKKAYGIRSKVLHGDKITSKLFDEAERLAPICDSYLRSVSNKIIKSESLFERFGSENGLTDDYFLRLMFIDGSE